MEIGDSLTGNINKISYCALSVVVNERKALYLQKYPPAGGAFVPNMASTSPPEDLTYDTISKTDMISFWLCADSYQPSGCWKGGRWGKSNLPTTDDKWMTGIFIHDPIRITLVKKGIIKMNAGPFSPTAPVLANTESSAWSCNVEYGSKTYSAYLTDNIMPQRANDVMFIWENNVGQSFIKLLTRGSSDNVDMPQRMMPGAGEHLEPGKDIKVKDGILRAIYEEIGIEESTLTEAYCLPLGKYASEGRDPRYWTYSHLVNGEIVYFGMKRGSETLGYVIYFKSSTAVAPKEVDPADTEEINTKWWGCLNTVLRDFPDNRWMIADHKKFIPDTLRALNEFRRMSPHDQENLRFSLLK